jgi:competence protein ComEA
VTALRALLALALLASATPALAAKKPLGPADRVDVGRAGVAELMRLPGVGRKKAEAIVARRNQAPFRRLEDLLSVKGVSRAWLEKQRSHLTLGTPPAATAHR